jgi:hypothetical protein
VRSSILILLAIAMPACSKLVYSQTMKGSASLQPATATTKAAGTAIPDAASHLTLIQTIPLDTVLTSSMGSPKCDGDGNFYLQGPDRGLTISKFNSKGEGVATFKASSSPDVTQVDGAPKFTVNADGQVYQLVFPHSYDRDVFIYNKDGSYKSLVKLEVSKGWSPSLFVAFPSGNFMATGRKWDRLAEEYVPFTGIFSSSGSLLKELHLEDDSSIGSIPMGLNSAISRGHLEIGSDGNVYLLRWYNPAIVYAISPGGEVVRRFTVDPGDQELKVGGMTVAGSRIAVVFLKGAEGKNIEREMIEVVDLEGNKVASYEEPMVDGHLAFGISLACYSHNPEQFTFLGWTKDEKLVLNITEPR